MPTLLTFAPRTPYAAETLRAKFQDKARRYANKEALPDNWQATTIGVLNSACKDNARRHSILAYLTNGKTSSKQLTRGEWWSLYAWIFPHHINDQPGNESCPAWCGNDTDTWHTHPALAQEIENVLRARLLEIGQAELPLPEKYVPDPHWEFEVN